MSIELAAGIAVVVAGGAALIWLHILYWRQDARDADLDARANAVIDADPMILRYACSRCGIAISTVDPMRPADRLCMRCRELNAIALTSHRDWRAARGDEATFWPPRVKR